MAKLVSGIVSPSFQHIIKLSGAPKIANISASIVFVYGNLESEMRPQKITHAARHAQNAKAKAKAKAKANEMFLAAKLLAGS